MAVENSVIAPVTFGGRGAGFAKLQGEDFCYYMVNYSIILGRNIENSEVDLDVSSFVGRSKSVSHHHAHIFYDFENHHFALEVLGRNGCTVQGVFYPPDSDPIKLSSQDLIEIVGVKMYFLLPTRSVFDTMAAERSTPCQAKKGKSKRKSKRSSRGGESNISKSYATLSVDPPNGAFGECDNSEHTTNNQRLTQEEEKDVVSSIVKVACDKFESGECIPMLKLHLELLQIWSQDNILKYLTVEEDSSTDTECKPWSKLLELLKKHPEHFIIYTKTRGKETSESVALISESP